MPHRFFAARPRLETLERRVVPAPFTEPPVLESVNGVLNATLTEQIGTATINGQPTTGTWTYNGIYVGPTLKANRGDLLQITIENELAQVTNLHTHGLHVSPIGNGDNVLLNIHPGESNTYRIRIPEDHPEGLFWYHPHRHGYVNDQIYHGLSGLLIIGRGDGNYPELDGLSQRYFALTNIQIDANNAVVSPNDATPANMSYLVNGLQNPTLTMQPNETQVWNIGDIGNTGYYNLSINGQTFWIVSEDGNPMTEPVSAQQLLLEPGKRYSILVTAPGAPGSFTLTSLGHNDGFNNWPPTTLATVNVTGTAVAPFTIPSSLGTFDNLADDPIAENRTLVFNQGPDAQGQFVFTINGGRFPDVPLINPRLNTVEEWTLLNPTTDQHPFHHHINDFQVMSINDQPYNARGHQDIINIPAAQGSTPGKVVIRIKYYDFIGAAVYHCHRVDHEDLGMMGLINIRPERPLLATGPGQGSAPHVKVFDARTNQLYASFFAFDPAFLGGVTVAVGDVNGDAIPDIIAGAGPGGGPHVKVIDGTKLGMVGPDGVIEDSALLLSFFAYDASFTGGVNVAGADIDTDGLVDVVTGAGSGGGPHVKVFSGASAHETLSFFAYEATFFGGVYVATGPVQGIAYDAIITGAGAGGGPHVKAFRYNEAVEHVSGGGHGGHGGPDAGEATSAPTLELISSFLAFDAQFRGGVRVGGTMTASAADFIVGAGPGAQPRVSRFAGPTSAQETTWLAYDVDVPTGIFVAG